MWLGETDDTPELRAEFLAGMKLLGFELVDLDDQAAIDELRARPIPFDPIQPQQLLVADALNAKHEQAVVEMPRRSSKTTTILGWCLGRCVSRPRYKVTFSAQKGINGIQAINEWKLDMLDRINPPDDDRPEWMRVARPKVKAKPKAVRRQIALFGDELVPVPVEDDDAPDVTESRGFDILTGNTRAGIYFDNGSSFVILKPDPAAYRGKAGDINWVDEGQDIPVEDGDALLAGILPLQDTRDEPKLVVSGTAGEVKAGALWSQLKDLRADDPEMGGLDFAVDPNVDWQLIKSEDTAIALLLSMHPGIGTLTTEARMRARWRKMTDKPKWAREYLSLWPETFGVSVIPPALVIKARRPLEKWPTVPERVAFGYDVKPNGSSAAVVAAWRDHRGRAFLETIEHGPGTLWLPDMFVALSKGYRTATIAYDDMGEGGTTATEALAKRPKPRLRRQTYAETAKGCVQMMRDLERGTLQISYAEDDLDPIEGAMTIATKREVRNQSGVWLFDSPKGGEDGNDITPLMAGVRALRNWDQWFSRPLDDAKPIMGD
ncbi:hypothetical protein [Herbiconiux flava]|uniref:Terminase n=1 Tax=Herbiconiux flava TaxID=881268 RepID=A0A852SU79_9MICO|nr:hypothetical protein [Herbiconiux flava]NYD72302.1 hypothetical protein [Herbiconiux flava]